MKIVPDIPHLAKEQNKQQEERKAPTEYHFVGSEKKVRGHIVFSFNKKTGEWKQAQVRREVAIDIDGNPVFKTIVAKEPDCIYVQALNLANAKKKLNKNT